MPQSSFQGHFREIMHIMGLDLEDDILSGCIITHGGELVNAVIKNARNS